jgi:hypothetical protein
MPDEGDFILYTVSQRDGLAWKRFKSAVDELYKRRARLHPRSIAEPPDRGLVMQNLASLGHCEYDSNRARIVASPPTLCLLPSPGLPTSVMAGARSPSTLELLRIAEGEMREAVEVLAESQTRSPGLPPLRISVRARSIAHLETFARLVGISAQRRPPAWDLLTETGSIDDYLESLSWSTQSEPDWERWDFDLEALHFGPPLAARPRIGLSRYRDPMRTTFRFRLRVEGRSAEVHPSWGRYALLALTSTQALAYDEEGHRLTVPRWVPLPPIIQRAAALCSGRSPEMQRHANHDNLVYEGIPKPYFELIAQRLQLVGAQ